MVVILFFLHNHLHFFCSSYPHVYLILPTLIEQYSKEQGQTVTILEETSDLETNVLQSTEEVVPSKDSISPSLVEEASELIIHNVVREEVTLDVAIEGDSKIEGKEDSMKFTAVNNKFTFIYNYHFYFSDLVLHALSIFMPCLLTTNRTTR